jgi:hypothetical protein
MTGITSPTSFFEFSGSGVAPVSYPAAGTYGDATHVAQITLDGLGHITAATNVAITGTGGGGGGSGTMTGPLSTTTGDFVIWNNTTGTLTADGGVVGALAHLGVGTGLTSSGGNLSVNYGTTAGSSAQGNDSRITGAEQTANKGVASGYAPLDGSALVPAANSRVHSVAGRTGAVTLAVADVSGAAPLASPALTGTPTAPTVSLGDNSTSIATTAWVKGQGYGGSGSVSGPGSSVNGNFASWNGTGGTTLADSGKSASSFLQPSNNLSDVGSAATSRTNLGLGTGNSPSFTGLSLTGTGALLLPVGTTAQEPSHAAGQIRWNSTTGRVEWDNGTTWYNPVRLSGDTMTGALTISSGGLSVTGGTSTDTLSITGSQSANLVLASPNGSSGAPSFRALALADLPTSAQGTVLYFGASGLTTLAPGTSGQVLTTNGASANPSWTTVSGGGGSILNGPGAGPAGWVTSRFYLPRFSGTSVASGLGYGILFAVPIFVPNSITVKTLTFKVTSAPGATLNVRMGIYTPSSTTNYPSTLVTGSDSGDVATGTTTGLKTSSTLNSGSGVTLSAGWYWLGFMNSASVSVSAINNNNTTMMEGARDIFGSAALTNIFDYPLTGVKQTAGQTYGAMPTTFGATTDNDGYGGVTPLVAVGT